MITAEMYREVRARLADAGHAEDYAWSQSLKPPATPDDLACEYTWVVLNSGMKNTVAHKIMGRVWPRLRAGQPVRDVFGHEGKARSIESVWRSRASLFESLTLVADVAGMLEWCEALPWIGPITKYHLAKNLGADVAKPDRWLVRLAEASGETVDGLCGRLAREVGDRVATVDVVLWRACAIGVLRVTNKTIGGT